MEGVKILRTSRKSVAIMVHPDGTVEVRAPKYIPQFAINAFVKSKSAWIEEKRALVLQNRAEPKMFQNGEKYMFLGRKYELELGNYIHIEFKDGKLLFPVALANQGRDTLDKWYIKEAKKLIKSLVDEYSQKMGTSYNAIMFSDTKSKWGSCTHDNRLQFNWRLIMAPLLVVRYVVIHELAHTTHKDHSAKFWNEVRAANPSYKQQIKWLKTHGHGLIV